jgi:alkylhydroperoxidase family enzyme
VSSCQQETGKEDIMALRVPKAELPAELRENMIKQLGAVPEPVEVMTNTPPTVTDELSASLLERPGPAALVELTVFIGFANLASRVNTAHGITSQGYSDACEIPLAGRPEKSVAASVA